MANRTFEARVEVVNNHRQLRRLRAPAEAQARPDAFIRGQGPGNDLLGRARNHIYFHEGPDADREIRVGPALYAINIQTAFDYYREGIRFATQNCTYEPYPRLDTCQIEVIFTCANVAVRGVLGNEIGGQDGIIHLCGNAFVVGLPDTSLFTAEESNRIVLTGIRRCVGLFDEAMRTVINERMNRPLWNTVATAETTPPDVIPELIEIMAVYMSAQVRLTMMNCYVGIFLAYTQQGNITVRKLNRISQDLAGINITITITTDQVRSLWNIFGPYFDENAARGFFPYWEEAFAGRVLRMQLLMQQVANAGLTGLTLIRTAIQMYPDFRWDLLAAKCPAEWQSFLRAHAAVGDNIYYGFRKDIGEVGVRHYKAIAYAGKKIHQELTGDQNMLALQTLTNVQIPEAPYIDNLIQTFKEYKRRATVEGDAVAAREFFGQNAPANFLAAMNRGGGGERARPVANERDLEALGNILDALNRRNRDEVGDE